MQNTEIAFIENGGRYIPSATDWVNDKGKEKHLEMALFGRESGFWIGIWLSF